MPSLPAFTEELMLLFVLVLTRISALVMSAPNFGSSAIPMRVRVFLAVTISLVVMPLVRETDSVLPENLVDLIVAMAQEAVIGMSVGLAVTILFTGLQVTGQTASQMSGISLADVIDPTTDTSVPAFAQLLNVVTTLVFFLLGGHREMIAALLDSFRALPPGHSFVASDLLTALTEILTQSFVLGIRGAAPVMLALLLALLVLGLISRTLPQLNVMAVGFGMNSAIMLGTLALSVGAIVWAFQDQVTPTLDTIRTVLVSSNPAPQ